MKPISAPRVPSLKGRPLAVVAFAAGCLVGGLAGRPAQGRADSPRLFELRIYHGVPGHRPALESRFRDTASKLLARHDLDAVGYWLPEAAPGWENTLVYLVAHASHEAAQKNWAALGADPAFQEMAKSEQAERLVERVEAIYMSPADFSRLR